MHLIRLIFGLLGDVAGALSIFALLWLALMGGHAFGIGG